METAQKTFTTLSVGGKELNTIAVRIVGETEKAFKLEVGSFNNVAMSSRIEWLPKSQTKVTEANGEKYLDITPWIALQKGIYA